MGLAGFMLHAQEYKLNELKAEIKDYTIYSYNELRVLCKDAGIKTETPKQQEMIDLLEQTNKAPVENYIKELYNCGLIKEAEQIENKYSHLLEKKTKKKTVKKATEKEIEKE